MAGYPPVVTTFVADVADAVASITTYQKSLADLEASLSSVGAALTAFDEKLAVVGRSANTARDELTYLDEGLVRVDGSFATAGDSAKALSSGMSSLNRSTSTVADRITAIDDALVGFASKADATEQSLTTFSARLTALNDELKVMSDTFKGVADSMTAMAVAADKVAVSQQKVTDSSKTQAATLRETQNALTLVGGALGIVDYATLKMAGNFQEQMTRLQTEAGLSDQQINQFAGSMSGLQQKVMDVGTATGFAGTQIAQALYEPVSAGLTLSNALDTVHMAAEEAQISGANLEDTTTALTSVMKNFGTSVATPQQAVADLNAIVGQGMMRFQDFNESVKNWAPTAATFGVSLNSVGAALAYMTDRGDSAQTAGTKLNQVMAMMVGQTNQAGELMQGLGLSQTDVASSSAAMSEAMATAHIRTSTLADDLRQPDGLFVALSDLKNHLQDAGLSADQADSVLVRAFGGGKQFKGLAEMINNLDGLQQKFDAISTDSNVDHFQEQWQKVSQTFNVEWSQMTASVKNLGIAVGDDLLPIVSKFLGFLGDLFGKITTNTAVLHSMTAGFAALAIAMPIAAIGIFITKMSDTAQAVTLTTTKIALMAGGFDYGITHINSFSGIVTLAVSSLVALQTFAPMVGAAVSKLGDMFGTAKTAVGVWMIEMEEAEGVAATSKVALSGVVDFLSGPWGIALALAAGAVALFASSSDQSAQNVDGLTQALQQDSGALGDNSRAWVVNQLQQQGALQAAKDLGLNLGTVTDAVMGNQNALNTVNAAIDKNKNAVQGMSDEYASDTDQQTKNFDSATKLGNAVGTLSGQVKDSSAAFKDQQQATGASTAATQANAMAAVTSSGANTDLTATSQKVTDALNNADSAAKDLTDQLALLDGNTISAEKGLITFRDDLDKITQAFQTNGKTIDDNTAAGRLNMTAILDAADAAQKHAEAVAKQTGSVQQGTAAFQQDVQALQNTMRQAGATQAQIDNLTKTYLQVPKDLNTNITNTAPQASSWLSSYLKQIDSVPGSITTAVNLVAKNLTQGHATGGLISKFATGGLAHFDSGGISGPSGFVSGPGTPTSDSIPAMLSDREFVIKADAVGRTTVPVLNAINDGDLPAAYGMLGSLVNSGGSGSVFGAPAGGGGGTTIVNINMPVSGTILTQTDLARYLQRAFLQMQARNGQFSTTSAFS